MLKMHTEWLKAAKSDLDNMSYILKVENLTHIIAFHAQQAVEKSLKAYIESQNNKVPKIHKIQTLIDMTKLDFDKYDDLIQLLDSLYIESRYPGDMGLLPHGKPTLEDAKEFYDFALEVFDKVCDMLDISKEELL